VAYAVDAGDLSRLNRFLVRNIASKTDLIITRTIHAANILKNMGVSAPIVHTADCAFTFKTEPKDEEILLQIWKNKSLPEVKNGFVGMAIIDFYLWPVVIRPWGKRENLYKWPYYFSRSKDRIIGSEKLAEKWASEADRIIEQYGKNIVIICMEEVDEPLAHKIIGKMKNSENAIITSSKEFNASQMTEILRSLELLITSRYHAAVLSLENTVPQLAVGHDPRLKGLYKDLKIDENYLIDYLSEKNAWQLIWSQLSKKVDYLLENPEKVHERLYNGYIEHLKRSKKNKNILKELLIRKGWDVSS
jgi:polysaccharide pyruvyl transferase WcaK-like protein